MAKIRLWLSKRALIVLAVLLGTVLSVLASSHAQARCFNEADCFICVLLYQTDGQQCDYTTWHCTNGDAGENLDCI